jgi:hypothetical protein
MKLDLDYSNGGINQYYINFSELYQGSLNDTEVDYSMEEPEFDAHKISKDAYFFFRKQGRSSSRSYTQYRNSIISLSDLSVSMERLDSIGFHECRYNRYSSLTEFSAHIGGKWDVFNGW